MLTFLRGNVICVRLITLINNTCMILKDFIGKVNPIDFYSQTTERASFPHAYKTRATLRIKILMKVFERSGVQERNYFLL